MKDNMLYILLDTNTYLLTFLIEYNFNSNK